MQAAAPTIVQPGAQPGAQTGQHAQAGTIRTALLSLLLGVVFLAGTGFSHLSVAHNAAHDARHAAGFPCH